MQSAHGKLWGGMASPFAVRLPTESANPVFPVPIHPPIPQAHATSASTVATQPANAATAGINKPSIPRLVSVANMPAAGVKPPYIHDWNPAAVEPAAMPAGPNPRPSTTMVTTVKDAAQTISTAKTAAWQRRQHHLASIVSDTHMVVTARQ